MPAAWPGFYF